MKDILRLSKTYDKFIFLSPHLDDAILSCGQLIIELLKKNADITVVTIFTKAKPNTVSPQGKQFLKQCGYKTSGKLFRDFNLEDKRVLGYLKAKCIHLGFTDAAWRTTGVGDPIYQNSDIQFSGSVSVCDKKLIKDVSQEIKSIINKLRGKTLVFAPLSVGGHVDHVITKKALEKINIPTIYWKDYPYCLDKNLIKQYFLKNKNEIIYLKLNVLNHRSKNRLIMFYKSQQKSLFPTGRIKYSPETYYLPNNSKLS